jgi:signal transduction histidine kinase
LLRGGVGGDLNGHQSQLLALAARNVGRLSGLVEDMLDFQRLDRARSLLELATVPAADLVRPAVEAARDDARAAGVEVAVGRCEGTVRVDPAGIGRVLGHLLTNAVKFSPPGSRTTVQAVRGSGGAVDFSVTVEGNGFEEGHLERIFVSFAQADASDSRAAGGVGLGLAICRAIVLAHQGSITATSCPGRGSTFSFTLAGVDDGAGGVAAAATDAATGLRAGNRPVDEPAAP